MGLEAQAGGCGYGKGAGWTKEGQEGKSHGKMAQRETFRYGSEQECDAERQRETARWRCQQGGKWRKERKGGKSHKAGCMAADQWAQVERGKPGTQQFATQTEGSDMELQKPTYPPSVTAHCLSCKNKAGGGGATY